MTPIEEIAEALGEEVKPHDSVAQAQTLIDAGLFPEFMDPLTHLTAKRIETREGHSIIWHETPKNRLDRRFSCDDDHVEVQYVDGESPEAATVAEVVSRIRSERELPN